MKTKLVLPLLLLLLLLSACSTTKEEASTSNNSKNNTQTSTTSTLTDNAFTIVAKEAMHELNNNVSVEAWTFNGSVPGSQIRVQEGEQVKIRLENELPDPVSIHWHGIPVPNTMDGIPGVTQNAVQPGEFFIYEFTVTEPGTYMYHTHQDGVNQLDKGLYGSFIVEPKIKSYDRDYSLMLDEWMSSTGNTSSMEGMDHSNMSGMDSNESTATNDSSMVHNMNNYDIYSINGKSGDLIDPLTVKEGENVRIRLTNVGFLSHKIHLHGHNFKVVAIDGQDINEPEEIKDQLITIAPGERYDIEFTANNPGEWYLECHGDMEGAEEMKTKIIYEGNSTKGDNSNQSLSLPEFNYTNYGVNKFGGFSLEQEFDLEYSMELNTAMDGEEMMYTINGKAFPETENIQVKSGDLVKVKLINKSSTDDHPMHLHGHFFQALSKNGKPLEGSPIVKDTINLKPGDEFVVAFKADNPGNWLFHCHDLHHATAGMVNMVQYEDFKSEFTPDPDANNSPE